MFMVIHLLHFRMSDLLSLIFKFENVVKEGLDYEWNFLLSFDGIHTVYVRELTAINI